MIDENFTKKISKSLSFLGQDLVKELIDSSQIANIARGNEILREGQYVGVIPIVLEGLIKVFSRYKERELLLYYIQPNESCVMSFAAGTNNEPSKIFALTEEDTTALLVPVQKVTEWITSNPRINMLFYQQYNLRYIDLIDTINHVLFDKMDQRLYDYLVEKSALTSQNPLKISHRQIATELGTAREVISRVMKKLEYENLVEQISNQIKIL